MEFQKEGNALSGILKAEGLTGIAVSELRCEFLLNLGRAAAQAVGRLAKHAPVCYVCRDPRRSADALEAALNAGLCAGGAEVHSLGELPAAAMALLMTEEPADLGIALAAGDAPYEISGVRLYGRGGCPVPEDLLDRISALLPASAALPPKSHRSCGIILTESDAGQRYLKYAAKLLHGLPAPEKTLRIAVDCAHGAASRLAALWFAECGAEVTLLHHTPDGLNINRGCGASQTSALREFVTAHEMDAGFALDGSAGRCIAVDDTGEQLSGSRLLAILCHAAISTAPERLKESGAAVTSSVNLGFLRYASRHGIPLHNAEPTAQQLLEKMRHLGLLLGGDGAGHIYFAGQPDADGLLTAARILRIMQQTGMPLSQLAKVMEPVPQVSVPVVIPPQWKEVWKNDPEIYGLITDCERALGEGGRMLIREHHREPFLTVMLEGSDFQQLNRLALDLAGHLSKCMNG